jgi:pimeloyl-ACP methyl ester carboxylesterase
MTPETHYAHSGNLSIAYQVIGDGPIDLVVVPGWISNIEVFWDDPHVARFFEKLATFSRLILFDKRGTGLSDRSIEAATLEERMDDMRAVLDAVGSERAALLGYSKGGTMCILFAATYPSRTAALITIGSYARRLRAPDYPYFSNQEEALKAVDAAAADWGGPVWIGIRIPSVADDPIIRQWWARFLRMSASASAAAALQRMNLEIDVRHVLPAIRAPTLIIHAKNDRAVPVGASRHMAHHILNAKLVEIESGDHLPFYENLASFDGPARAIKCAEAIVKSLATLGISCRIGLHTGECEVRHGQLHGIALHIAARVAALAPPNGVFVSQTVKDLVAGSGIRFADAGLRTLKGLSEEWRLYEVMNQE